MKLKVLESKTPHTELVLEGRLDTSGVGLIETRFYASIGPKGQSAAVDMRGIDFVSSMGIRMLVTAAKSLDAKGKRLVLHSARPVVESALRDTGIDAFIPLAADRDAALALLQKR